MSKCQPAQNENQPIQIQPNQIDNTMINPLITHTTDNNITNVEDQIDHQTTIILSENITNKDDSIQINQQNESGINIQHSSSPTPSISENIENLTSSETLDPGGGP